MLSNTFISTNKYQSVLIADDDEMVLDVLSKGFEFHGFRVFRAENGLKALTIFNSEQIDLVLTDIKMPRLNGMDLSRLIRRQAPSLKIAVMTGSDAGMANELVKEGTADYCFLKPFRLSKVCNTMINGTHGDDRSMRYSSDRHGYRS
jgi:DNA-binding response OmpR family regulator